MHPTADDIPAGPMSLSEVQDWMVKHNVENPEVLRLLLDKQGQGGGKKNCPICDHSLKCKGTRCRSIHTGRTGLIPVSRAYFICENAACRFTWFPLDDLLGLSPGRTCRCMVSCSGSVESAMKYLIQARLKKVGMKWTRGAGVVIHLRGKIYDGQWGACWSARRRHFSYG